MGNAIVRVWYDKSPYQVGRGERAVCSSQGQQRNLFWSTMYTLRALRYLVTDLMYNKYIGLSALPLKLVDS